MTKIKLFFKIIVPVQVVLCQVVPCQGGHVKLSWPWRDDQGELGTASCSIPLGRGADGSQSEAESK